MTHGIGTLYIISAPSGGGKTSLVNALLKTVANLEVSISHTTRPARPSEITAVNYHFVNEALFHELIEQEAFLEYAKVFGNYYGTSRHWVMEKLRAGIDIVLEIDWQGAQQIRNLVPNSVSIFILPPTWETIQARLQARAQDKPEVIAARMASAHIELTHHHEYDYLVINDKFDIALQDLQFIIQARRLRCEAQQQKYADLLGKLLA